MAFCLVVFVMMGVGSYAQEQKPAYPQGSPDEPMRKELSFAKAAESMDRTAVVVATLPKSAQELWPKPSRPVPFLLMLGTADPLVKFEGSGQTLSAEDTVTFWRKQNGCEGGTQALGPAGPRPPRHDPLDVRSRFPQTPAQRHRLRHDMQGGAWDHRIMPTGPQQSSNCDLTP